MEPSDITVAILRGIRDEVHALREDANARFGETNAHLDAMRDGLEALRDDTKSHFQELDRRRIETEVRLSTEIVAVAGAIREVRDLLRDDLTLRSRVDDHEHRLAALEKRSG
jgi:hypothetical protein